MISRLEKLSKMRYCFSQYFEQRDKSEIIEYYDRKAHDARYIHYTQNWRRELEKKHKRRARMQELEAQRPKPVDQVSKLIIHDPVNGVELPPSASFAVCLIGARQYKITKDDLVISEYLHGLDINTTVEFTNVLMVGTKDYTVLGRPYIENARIRATVEQQTLSDKEIVFKKKRRKRYMKSQGHRQQMTVLRINEIIHEVGNEQLSRAVALI